MKRGTHNHPKVWITCKILGIRRPALLGHLELLWDFTTQYAPQGDIGRYPDDRIEGAMDWSGRRGKLLDGLVQGGWVERHPTYRLVIHDWHDHCNESVKKILHRRREQFVTVSMSSPENVETSSRHRQISSATLAENGSLPLPLPKPLPIPVPSPPTDHRIAIDAIYNRHPKKAGRMLYEQALAIALSEAVSPDALMAKISESHAAWCESEDWQREGGKYAPKLANWIRDAGYLDAPPVAEEETSSEPPPEQPTFPQDWQLKSHWNY